MNCRYESSIRIQPLQGISCGKRRAYDPDNIGENSPFSKALEFANPPVVFQLESIEWESDGGDLFRDQLLPSSSHLSWDQVFANRREKAGPEMALPFLCLDLPGNAANPTTDRSQRPALALAEGLGTDGRHSTRSCAAFSMIVLRVTVLSIRESSEYSSSSMASQAMLPS